MRTIFVSWSSLIELCILLEITSTYLTVLNSTPGSCQAWYGQYAPNILYLLFHFIVKKMKTKKGNPRISDS